MPVSARGYFGEGIANIEYIILDDGSSDDTPQILKQYGKRIIWETQVNMGEPRTVNKGFAMAKGDYVMVVNADDPLLLGAISKQVKYMEKHTNVLATYPDWIEIDEHSTPFKKIIANDYDYLKMVRQAACVPGPGALIRRKALEFTGGRNPNFRFVTDMDFWFRLGLRGDLARIPEFLATHRTHRTSSGIKYRPEVGTEIVSYIEQFFTKPNLPQEVQKFYKQALSSAHFEAGARAATYKERRKHFLHSFRLCPINWIKRSDHRSLWKYGALLLPESIYNFLRPAMRPYKRWLLWRKSKDEK